jgi:hypothetical protein
MLLLVAVLAVALLILAQPENALDPYAIDLDGMRPLVDWGRNVWGLAQPDLTDIFGPD